MNIIYTLEDLQKEGQVTVEQVFTANSKQETIRIALAYCKVSKSYLMFEEKPNKPLQYLEGHQDRNVVLELFKRKILKESL